MNKREEARMKRLKAAIARGKEMAAADDAKGRQLARDVVSGRVSLVDYVFCRAGWAIDEYRGFISELVRMAEKGAVPEVLHESAENSAD